MLKVFSSMKKFHNCAFQISRLSTIEVPHQMMDVNGQAISHDPSNENLEDDESSLLVIAFNLVRSSKNMCAFTFLHNFVNLSFANG